MSSFSLINAQGIHSAEGFEVLIRIIFAVVIGCVIGIEREYKNRPAGMRTHSLVCLGAAMAAILECLIAEQQMYVGDGTNISMTIGRLSAQVISGIGFLGAGTIFIAQKKISGLTTAASLWNVACLGLLIGFGYYWLALIVCGFVMIVLVLLQRVIRVNAVKRVEIRFVNRVQTLAYINEYFEKNGIKVLDVDFHIEQMLDRSSLEHNVYTNIYTLHLPGNMHYSDMVTRLSEYTGIQTVRTRNT